MDPFVPLALLFSRDAVIREVDSARPWAPVVEPRPPRRPMRRSRAAVAGLLERAAHAVAPSPAHAPAHAPASRSLTSATR
ncbi:hypothetical protein [Pengzhenrongella sicca]|uniref:Uncharacterized protein n=1 Tax=Pengzhenrongella sicca TaxID=2819238 RepID=A0A8A4ZC79_9MICO|nr:hypothetical protein [Pengzhenrongella sicca]QTE28196.1 hypothetical protein J4E96_12430 [Pengzhenrongella sicca]